MIRPALAALLCLGLAAAPAAADPPADAAMLGECGFASMQDQGPGGWTHTGEVEAAVVAYSPTPAHNPVSISTLTCVLQVNGVAVVTLTRPGAGPLAVVEPTVVTYEAGPFDVVELCTIVEVVDAHGQAQTLVEGCGAAAPPVFPPQPVTDLLGYTWSIVDPIVCVQFQALAPLPPNDLVLIDGEGDIYVSGWLFWDCPPYEWT